MGLLANQPGDDSDKIPPDILRRLKAGEDVPGYVVDRRPVQVPRGTGYGADAEFMNDPSGAMTTLIYKTTGRNTWKSNGDTAEVYDEDGNFIGVSSGDSNALALTKFIASSVAAGYGADYVNGLEAGATASGGMGNGAFLGENVASGVGAWDANAISAGLDLGGGTALSGADDLVGSDLFDLTHEGVNFGSETVGNGIKANASSFGPNYSNAASGLGTKAAGGASLVEGLSSLLGSATAGDWLKTGVGVLGVMASNSNARDVAEQNRQFTTDQTKLSQDFQSTENQKNRDATDKSREDTQLFTSEETQKSRDYDTFKTKDQREYEERLQREKWERMMPVSYGQHQLTAVPGTTGLLDQNRRRF